ncbi:hypothetical protein SAMN05428961_10279 [Paenibacillus sp. OK060]|uniref:hypothetical protein n=1 Tax=Paenibacillus sp. OK060 TaxID=1881034 RepID=UPI000890F24A|nr:hypothetical protein [Paenibacillus sp. OK060]SDK43817.1 hypothetical protein SAMN05428961_10279 [Paenibacillus sp. OK060]
MSNSKIHPFNEICSYMRNWSMMGEGNADNHHINNFIFIVNYTGKELAKTQCFSMVQKGCPLKFPVKLMPHNFLEGGHLFWMSSF